MQIKYLILSLFLASSLFYQTSYAGCESTVFEVTFLTGVRFQDGYGDLALNKTVIENQYASLKAKYGDCLRVNIVYPPEVSGRALVDVGDDRYHFVNKVFQGELFSDASRAMFQGNTESRADSYTDEARGITHYTSDSYVNSGRRADVQVYVSDISTTVNNPQSYDIDPRIRQMAPTVSFLEHSGPGSGGNSGDYVHYAVAPDKVRGNEQLSIRVNTGVTAAGLYLSESNSEMNQTELHQFIEEGVVGNKYFTPLINGEDVKGFLSEDLTIMPLYVNDPEKKTIATRSSVNMIFVAYEDYLMEGNPEKKYLMFGSAMGEVDLDVIKRRFNKFYDIPEGDSITEVQRIMQQDFYKFLDENFALIAPGNNLIPSGAFKSMFDPDNGARYQVASGFSSYQDIVNMGSYPLYFRRNYHRRHVNGLVRSIKAILTEHNPDIIQNDLAKFVKTSQDINSLHKGQITSFVQDYRAVESNRVNFSNQMIQRHSAFNYMDDMFDTFYRERAAGSADISRGVVARAMFGNEKSDNAFMRGLSDYSETYRDPLSELRNEEFIRNPFYNFCLQEKIRSIRNIP